MRKATRARGLQKGWRSFTARRSEQGQTGLARHDLKAVCGLAQVGKVLIGSPAEDLPGLRARAGADFEAGRACVCAPIGMVIGMRGKAVSFGCAGSPPRGPVFAQRAITGLGFFMRREKCDRHLLLL